jgi:hypothetical protein
MTDDDYAVTRAAAPPKQHRSSGGGDAAAGKADHAFDTPTFERARLAVKQGSLSRTRASLTKIDEGSCSALTVRGSGDLVEVAQLYRLAAIQGHANNKPVSNYDWYW